MNRTASLAAWGFAALAFGLATVDCGSGLPGLDDDLQFEGVIGQGFYSRSTDTHDLILSATIVNTKDGGGKLTRWSVHAGSEGRDNCHRRREQLGAV